jgi:YfiH family protein
VLRLENREHPLEEVRRTPADAIITDQPGVAIGVLTADCVPILLVDPVKRAVAAVHAGREGSLRSILSRVIQKMRKEFHSSPQDLHAAVGPSVETECYEVGDDVVGRVQDRYKHRREVLVRNHGATYLDLRKINHFDLLENGLREDRIYHLPLCTACHSRTFYSYRKRGGQETGRMMALIMLRED